MIKEIWNTTVATSVGIGEGVAFGVVGVGSAFVNPAYIGGASYIGPTVQGNAIGEAMISNMTALAEDPGKAEYWKALGSNYANLVGGDLDSILGAPKNITDTWNKLGNELSSGWDLDSLDWDNAQQDLNSFKKRNNEEITTEAINVKSQTENSIKGYIEAYAKWKGNPDRPYYKITGNENSTEKPSRFDKALDDAVDWWTENVMKQAVGGNGIVKSIFYVSSDYKSDESEKIKNGPAIFSSERILAHKITNRRSSAIEAMLNSGPDFINHHFDIYLMITIPSENKSESIFNEVFGELFGEQNATYLERVYGHAYSGMTFSVRTGSIEIPQMESDTFELKFLFESIKKVKTKVKFERKAELKMTLDEPLFLMNFIDFMSNNNEVRFNFINEDNRKNMEENHYNYYSPYSTLRIVGEELVQKRVRLDIIVNHNVLNDPAVYPLINETREYWRTTNGGNLTDEDKELVHNFAGLRYVESPLWWFEDVNFLGQGEDLTFDRDATDITTMTFPFLFKRVVKIDRQYKYKTGEWLKTGDPDGELKRFYNKSSYH